MRQYLGILQPGITTLLPGRLGNLRRKIERRLGKLDHEHNTVHSDCVDCGKIAEELGSPLVAAVHTAKTLGETLASADADDSYDVPVITNYVICDLRKCWEKRGRHIHEAENWMERIQAGTSTLSGPHLIQSWDRVFMKYQRLNKTNAKKEEIHEFLEQPYTCNMGVSKKKEPDQQHKTEKLNSQLQKENVCLQREKSVLEDIVVADQKMLLNLDGQCRVQQKEMKDIKHELQQKTKELSDTKTNMSSIKGSNYYKRLQRKERKLDEKENVKRVECQCLKRKLSKAKKRLRFEEEENVKYRCKYCKTKKTLEESIRESREKSKSLQTNVSDQKARAEKYKDRATKAEEEVEKLKVRASELEIERDECQEQLDDIDKVQLETKTSGRYSNDVRSCALQLATQYGVAEGKVGPVMQAVSEQLFHNDLSQQNLPSRATVSNILAEGYVLGNLQVAEALIEGGNFGIFGDGTTKDGQKVVDHGVMVGGQKKEVLSMGFTEIAREDSETTSNIVKEKLKFLCELHSDDQQGKYFEQMLKNWSFVMSDRASVMKRDQQLLGEWRKTCLDEMDSGGTDVLHQFFCSAHTLLGFSDQSEKTLLDAEKQFGGKLGRTNLEEFEKWHETESCAKRLMRTSSMVMGPRPDQKSGVRQQWLGYCDMVGTHSEMVGFKDNRFNNYFATAAGLYYHRNDISKFLKEFMDTENRLLKSISADIDCPPILEMVRALGIMYVQVNEPLWRIFEDKDISYLDLGKYFQPLYFYLRECSSDPESLLGPDFKFVSSHVPDHSTKVAKALLDPNFPVTTLTKACMQALCAAFLVKMDLQLKDFLPSGKYSLPPTDSDRERTMPARLTNKAAENMFGEYDYATHKKPSATIFHHSSSLMIKQNKTVTWMNKKTATAKKCLWSKARTLQVKCKAKVQQNAKDVKQLIQDKLKKTKESKQMKAQKKQDERDNAKQKVEELGLATSAEHINTFLNKSEKQSKRIEYLKAQLRFHKLSPLKCHCDRKLFAFSEGGLAKTEAELKENLIKIICSRPETNAGTENFEMDDLRAELQNITQKLLQKTDKPETQPKAKKRKAQDVAREAVQPETERQQVNNTVNKDQIAQHAEHTHTVEQAAHSTQHTFKLSQIVAVGYHDTWYPGTVIDVTPANQGSVKFMHPTRNGHFQWPHKDDIQCLDAERVLCTLTDITPVGSGRYFDIEGKDAVDAMYMEVFRNIPQVKRRKS